MNCTTFVPASKLLPAEDAPSPATPAANETETAPRLGRRPTQTDPSAGSRTASRSPSPRNLTVPGLTTRRGSAAAVAHPPTPTGAGQPPSADDAASPLALEAALQRLSLRQGGRESRVSALREPPRLPRRPTLSLPPPPLRNDAETRAEMRLRALTLPWEAGARPAWLPEAGAQTFFRGPNQQHPSSALGLFFGPRVPWPEEVRDPSRAASTSGVRSRSPEEDAETGEEGRDPKRHCRRR